MSLQTEWNQLVEEVRRENNHRLKDIVDYIEEIRDNPTQANSESLERKLNDLTITYLITLDQNEFERLDRIFKHQVNLIKNTINKQKEYKPTKWEMYVMEARSHADWLPIHNLIDEIERRDNKDITEEDIDRLYEKFKTKVIPFAEKNLSPENIDWTSKEFNKKLRIFKNRINRVIEDDFGSWIRQLRKSKGYSLKDLEDASGVTASYIHRIETGSRKTPSIPVAEKLAVGLGVNPGEFLKKLNLINVKTENREMLTGFAETIAMNSFTINGKKVTKEQKEQIIELYNAIVNATWNEDTKLQEGMQIINIVDKVKKTFR